MLSGSATSRSGSTAATPETDSARSTTSRHSHALATCPVSWTTPSVTVTRGSPPSRSARSISRTTSASTASSARDAVLAAGGGDGARAASSSASAAGASEAVPSAPASSGSSVCSTAMSVSTATTPSTKSASSTTRVRVLSYSTSPLSTATPSLTSTSKMPIGRFASSIADVISSRRFVSERG